MTHDTQGAQILQKMSVTHICSKKEKQCALPVIINLPIASCAQVHELHYRQATGRLLMTGRTYYVFLTNYYIYLYI